MKKNLKSISLLAISLFCLNSCNDSQTPMIPESILGKEVVLIPETAKLVETKSLREIYSSTEAIEFAKLLAISLKDKDIRQFLKDEANKRFDGDYDILVKNILNSKVGTDSFESKIKKNSPNGYAKGQETFDNALKNDKLNISIPVLIEKWDVKSQIPLVGISIGMIDGTTKYIKGYDYLGKEYIIDAVKEPNLPVIIIGENERVDYTGKLYKEKTKTQLYANNLFSDKNAKIACVSPYRQDSKWEILKAMFITEQVLDQVESWTLGAPEIKVECWAPVNTTNFSTLTKIGGPAYYVEPDKRADIRDKWWTIPIQEPLFPWIRSVNSRSVIFFFWEWDNNYGSQNITIANTFKIPSQNGGPETTTNLSITTTIPNSAREIVKPLIDQDVCPIEFNGTWGVYGGGFKWAVISQ